MNIKMRIILTFSLLVSVLYTISAGGNFISKINNPNNVPKEVEEKYNFSDMVEEHNGKTKSRVASIEDYKYTTGIGLQGIRQAYAIKMEKKLEEIKSIHGDPVLKEIDLNNNNIIEYSEITIYSNKQ